MKLTIDFTNKLITVEETCNLDEMIKQVQKLLPDDWKEYKLNQRTIEYAHWYVQNPQPIPCDYDPLYGKHPVTCDDSLTGSFTVHTDSITAFNCFDGKLTTINNSGTFNN